MEHVSAMELALRMTNASLDKFASMEHVAMELALKMTNAMAMGFIATWILTNANCSLCTVDGCW